MKKLLLPLWLVFLAILTSLPPAAHAPDLYLELNASQSSAVTSLPVQSTPDSHPSNPVNQSPGASPAPYLHFDRLSVAEGLSFSLATTILQDQQGYMWFGTQRGLNKYDGYTFTTYILDSVGPDVIYGNYVSELFKDHTGDLWIATPNGLVRRDIKTGTFIHYKSDYTNPQTLSSSFIFTIGEDSTEALWVGTNMGLDHYDRTTDTFARYLPNRKIYQIYRDHLGEMWLGTNRGLLHYSSDPIEQQQPESFTNKISNPASISSDTITTILEDQQSFVWVGTDNGLNRFNRETGEFTRYKQNLDEPYSLSNNSITSILEDDIGRLWIGTSNGLNLLDRETGRFYAYLNNPDDPYSLSNDYVREIYQDRSGVVWVATLAGINKVNETASRFVHYQKQSNPATSAAETQTGDMYSLSDDMVTAVFEDDQGILWVGTSLGGLNRLDRKTGNLTVYKYDPNNYYSISAGEINAIYEDQDGTLWVGTDSGLNQFDPKTELFTNSSEFPQSPVTSLIEDQQGNLWVGHFNGVLRRLSGESAFAVVPSIRYQVARDRVQGVYPDRTGAVWISTQNDGLYRLDSEGEAGGSPPAVVHFPQDSSDPHSPGVGPVISFYEDAHGVLWMGSVGDGLIRFDRDSQTFIHYFPDTGQAGYVSCIQGDSQGFLWLGTILGLARFDPTNETFRYFDARDGLLIGEGLDCFQNKQGEMFFGSLQGLNTFFPEQIRDNPNPPPVVITAINLNNQPLRTDISPNEQIKLSYGDNYISFDFAALDYTSPARNQYAYRMEGLESDWVEAGTRRHADYPNLKPGTYTFRVKASNNSGVWNEEGAAVRIAITPPFWQTWWFLGLLGVTLVGAIAGGVWLRLKGVETRSHDLEKQVSERTGALEEKTLELQLRTLEIELRRHELEALLSADDRMQRCLHQDQVLQALVDVAIDIVHADLSAVFRWDEKREKLSIKVARGFSQQALSELQFSRGEGMVAGVALSGEPVLVTDSLTDPRRSLENPQLVKIVLDLGIRSFMFLPITIDEETLGAFNVSYTKPNAVGEEEQRLFQAITQRAALYIENARLYEQSQELAVLEERSRLARELHDAVTQTLFSASLVAEALPTVWENDPQEGRSLLQELRGLSRGALAEMRTLLLELRPAALLESSLADLLRQLGEAASGREGIPVNVQVEGRAGLPPDVQIALYRITQEALNNVVKHARAHQATVRLCYLSEGQPDFKPGSDGELTISSGLSVLLSISDDGRGFDPAQSTHSRLGLGIMQERAQAIGAILTIKSQLGQGTQVTVLWKQDSKQEAK